GDTPIMTAHELTVRERQEVKDEQTRPGRTYVPDVDIYETPESLWLTVDLPGVDETSVQVNLSNGVLSIDGQVSLKDYGEPRPPRVAGASGPRPALPPPAVPGCGRSPPPPASPAACATARWNSSSPRPSVPSRGRSLSAADGRRRRGASTPAPEPRALPRRCA